MAAQQSTKEKWQQECGSTYIDYYIYEIDKDKFEYATQHIMNIRSTKMCLTDKDIVSLPLRFTPNISISAPTQ